MKTWREIIESELLVYSPYYHEQDNLEFLASCYHLGMLAGYPLKAEIIDYSEAEDLLRLSVLAVIADDIEFIHSLLEYQTRKRFVWYILDMLIQCAIDTQRTEIQVMLVDHKYRNNLFRKKQFEL